MSKCELMMDIIFSIIVPVYNVKDFLSDCLDSILIQEGTIDYEIILVDDGSNDGSENLCDEYAIKYSFIKTFHKKNGGLSDARNYGIKRANGEYILFLDSDDYIKKTALKECREAISEAKRKKIDLDVIISEGQYFDRYGETRCEKWFDKKSANTSAGCVTGEMMLGYTLGIHCNWAAWGKYYRRQFWNENKYSFLKGRLSEDMQIIDQTILEAKNVCMISPFVYYRFRKGSIVNEVKINSIISIVDNLKDWNDYFEHMHIKRELENGIRFYLAQSFFDVAFSNVYNVIEGDIPKAFQVVNNNIIWLNYLNKKGKIVLLLCKTIGVRNTCKICSKYKRYKKVKECYDK